jgi:glutathione S-transferase
MRLHDHAASGNCYKARLLLSLLAIAYERVEVDIFAGDTLTDEYAALNPVRETPVLELDDGTTIAQSNAILAYLAHGTAYLPEDRLEQAQVHQWLAFEQERVMGGIGGPRFRRLTGRPEIPGRLATGREALAVLDEHLERRAWLVGDGPTIADVAIYSYVARAPEGNVDLSTYPAVDAFLRRVEALPGFVPFVQTPVGLAA